MGPFVDPDLTFDVEHDGVVFKHTALSGKQLAAAMREREQGGDDAMQLYMAELALRDWQGEGAPAFPDDVKDAVAILTFPALMAIVESIMRASQVSDVQAGN